MGISFVNPRLALAAILNLVGSVAHLSLVLIITFPSLI